MKILVTGSEGYIGKHLIQMLEKYSNHEISKLDIKDNRPIDITENFGWSYPFDCVIHLAALVNVGESVNKPLEYYNTNLFGTVNVLKTLNFKNFIFASTGAATNPTSPYALSKRAAEDVVEKFCKDNNKQFTTFRFYNVVGSDGIPPTNPDGLFSNLMKAETTGVFNLFGDDYDTIDGSCIRDYLHVNEVCASLIKAIDAPSNQLENLGHGIGTSVKQMIDIYKAVNNCEFEIKVMPRRPGDLEISVLDNVSKYMTKQYSIDQLLRKFSPER